MSLAPLLTVKEAAQRARIHPDTLNALIRRGSGPATTQLGCKVLVREDALALWIEANTAATARPRVRSRHLPLPPAAPQAMAI